MIVACLAFAVYHVRQRRLRSRPSLPHFDFSVNEFRDDEPPPSYKEPTTTTTAVSFPSNTTSTNSSGRNWRRPATQSTSNLVENIDINTAWTKRYDSFLVLSFSFDSYIFASNSKSLIAWKRTSWCVPPFARILHFAGQLHSFFAPAVMLGTNSLRHLSQIRLRKLSHGIISLKSLNFPHLFENEE